MRSFGTTSHDASFQLTLIGSPTRRSISDLTLIKSAATTFGLRIVTGTSITLNDGDAVATAKEKLPEATGVSADTVPVASLPDWVRVAVVVAVGVALRVAVAVGVGVGVGVRVTVIVFVADGLVRESARSCD